MKTLFNLFICKFAIKHLSTSVPRAQKHQYDLIVVGVTTAGLAAAKEASNLGAKVAVADTCGTKVAGNLPQKLMHQVAVIGEAIYEAKFYGWKTDGGHQTSYNWESLRKTAEHFAKSSRNAMMQDLKLLNIDYINEEAGKLNLSGKYFLVGLQCKTQTPGIPGDLEYGTLCEDLIKKPNPPGRTLVIGAGRYGLECAGVLNGLGYDTAVMVRSKPLKHCDQQMAAMITAEMRLKGVKFLLGSPRSITKLDSGKLEISWVNTQNTKLQEEFDTILFATGRKSVPVYITHPPNSQLFTLIEDSARNTVQEGQLLARKLFAGSTQTLDYTNTPTTIYTPLQYSFVGISEEEAICQYKSNIEVYHSFYKPPEFSISKKNVSNCYLKVVSLREGEQKVLGLHFLGPHADDVIRGFTAAMRCNLTVEKLKNTVGIHPTVAEEFTKIRITKKSGEDPTPASCCN